MTILGRPNVGKSTLLNQILGGKLAIVSPKPQTTRHRILGVKHLPEGQLIFLDTPGVHQHPRTPMDEQMVRTALSALQEADLALFMVEATSPHHPEEERLLRALQEAGKPTFLLINKIDRVPKAELLPMIDRYSRQFEFREIIPISALTGDGVDIVLRKALEVLPEGPALFPEDMVTDLPTRFLAAELIREKIFHLTGQEIPYATAVQVEEFAERREGLVYIRATIWVEKRSQKAIVVGKGGSLLKRIGQLAREDIERLVGSKVYLELWVKVKPHWRRDGTSVRLALSAT